MCVCCPFVYILCSLYEGSNGNRKCYASLSIAVDKESVPLWLVNNMKRSSLRPFSDAYAMCVLRLTVIDERCMITFGAVLNSG